MVRRYLSHLIKTKGFFDVLVRFTQIIRHFLFGEKRFLQMITFLENNFQNQDIKITFCITTSLLNTHMILFKKLQEKGYNLAAHGFFHIDMTKKNKREQSEIIRKSYQTFEKLNMPICGFRCPYLSYNDDTIRAFKTSPLLWISNDIIVWENHGNRRNNNYLKKLGYLYHWTHADQSLSLPRFMNQLVEIPITAPDDEMLLDRYNIKKPKEISAIWLSILKKSYNRGELFHLLFHPERFSYIKDAVNEVIVQSKNFNPSIWIASLTEIATWWKERGKSTWNCERVQSGGWRVWLRAPEKAQVLMKLGDGMQTDAFFYKNYIQVKPIAERNGSLSFSAGKSRSYTIGISGLCSKQLEDFLVEEGFLVERTDQPGNHSLYIDEYKTFNEEDKLPLLEKIDNSPFPLLRLWRWPNGARSALCISADIDAITLTDFIQRAIHF